MNVSIKTVVETRIMDAKTGKQVGGQTKENLVLDGGLNSLAQSSALGLACVPATMSNGCLIGSGTSPNSIGGGAVTFTQSGTTITASGSFFTSNMVGWIFKYGTGSGGTEVYITAFTNATTVTVGTSLTVSSPTAGTVWNVARTTLDTFLFQSNTYQTNAGDCGTTISGNQATHKRTYKFPQQGSPYTVNEIGYASGFVSQRVLGRVVLGSSDVVGTSNFYVVVISITVTYSPSAPLSVTNVGTNINTAGTLMCEAMSITIVTSSGATANNISVSSILELEGTLCFKTSSYSQNGSINPTAGITVSPRVDISGGSRAFDNTKVGSCTLTFNTGVATTGQTLFGICLRDTNVSSICLDVLFTTPQTAPTGTFQPNTVWRLTYTRTLVN